MKRVVAQTLASLFLSVLPLQAVSAAGEDNGGASVSLPQLDPASFPSQILWLGITFLVMYLVFSRKALPEISGAIENRQEYIQNDLGEAEKLKEEAEKVHQAYEEILEESRNKASELFVEVEDEVKQQAVQALDKFRSESSEQTQLVEKNIAKAAKEAMKDMDGIAAEVAAQAAQKIAGISTDIDQAKSVIENMNKKAA